MSDQVGFVTMGEAKGPTEEIPSIGIGMLGYAFMGKAHANAYKKLPYIFWPPPAMPRLVSIAGRSEQAVAVAAQRYGFAGYTTNWRELLANPEIQLFDNGGPNNLHAEPTIAAAEAGKHVICEKPLGRTAAEARQMWEAVKKAGVKNVCGFNYRFVPAVRQARQLIEQGTLGRIYHFRASYLQEWIADPEFPMVWRLNKSVAGTGALGDMGSHIIDLARFLVGEPKSVNGLTATFIKERPLGDGSGRKGAVDVDDAFVALVEFENGALGTLEASRFAVGRKNYNTFEINGSKGSIRFNLERMNELEVCLNDVGPREARGFADVLVTESYHPYYANWWPQGHIIGWENTFVHEINHLLEAIFHGKTVEPYGATFEDGYRCAVICDAISQSAENGGARAPIAY
jgi:predicted dehydrogenase